MTDLVNHPPHYIPDDPTYETIKVLEAWRLGYHLGNCVKYISRAGKKGPALEDLKKARWYLDREICNLEKKADDDKRHAIIITHTDIRAGSPGPGQRAKEPSR